MNRAPATLSVIFEDPTLESNFKRYKQEKRVKSNRISYIAGVASLWKFYSEAEYHTVPAQILRTFIHAFFIFEIFSFFLIFSKQPMVMAMASQWRNSALPTLGAVGIVLNKLTIPLLYHNNGVKVEGSSVRAVVFIVTSRANIQLSSVGLTSITGVDFLWDLGFHAASTFAGFVWNKDECEILCNLQPEVQQVYEALDRKMASWMSCRGCDPIRACIATRVLLQVLLGWCLPSGLDYWREMSERAEFLKSARIPFPERRWRDYFFDGLICLGSMTLGVGIAAAAFMAFPELARLSVILLEGFYSERLRN
eukprot:jgi/Botrbrau1/22539/Bobra.114_2s0063.1